MKDLIFSGCSFTENYETWAHMVHSIFEYDLDDDLVEHMCINQKINIDTFYQDVNQLSSDQYRANVIAESSGSNSMIVRRLIHFIENYPHDIDTIIFQITGFDRRELLISDHDIINQTYTDCNDGTGVQVDDLIYLKQDTPSCVFSNVVKEDPPADYVRKTAAYFYSKVHEPWEYRVRNIEALQMLTIFCLAHSIRLAYFHGWNNYPIETSSYFDKKYQRYVKPYLLPQECLWDYVKTAIPLDKVRGPDGGHPSAIAHKAYWNDVVYPFIIN